MNKPQWVWVVKYNQVLGDIIYVCETEACANEQARLIVKENRFRFDEYPEDRPPKSDELPYSRMDEEELLGWWFEYTEAAEDIEITKLEILSEPMSEGKP